MNDFIFDQKADSLDVTIVPPSTPIQPPYRTRMGEKVCATCGRPEHRCRCWRDWEEES